MRTQALAAVIPTMILGYTLLAAGTARANTMFVINYTGVILDGSVHNIDTSQTHYTLDLTAGSSISGTLVFDLDHAPTPSVNINGSITQVSLTDSGSPFTWVGGTLTLTLPALLPNSLPVPASFTLNRRFPPANGSYSVPPTVDQILDFTYTPTSLLGMLGGAQFVDSWQIPGSLVSQGNEFIGLLVNSIASYVPYDGFVPLSFDAPNASGGSAFGFIGYTDDTTHPVPPLFGLSENYQVGGHFETTSAFGRLITPEPGTWCLGAVALLFAARRRQLLKV